MDLSQTTPKALTKDRKAEMVRMILDEPDTGYRTIADRFGVAYSTVTRVANDHGIRRKADLETSIRKKQRKDRLPGGGELREGGIVANDEQWRARMQRIG